MSLRRAQVLLALGALLCLAVLTHFDRTYLSPGGLSLFDILPTGYDLNHARAFVGGLGAIEVAVYSGPYRVVDTLFPLLLAALLAVLLYERVRRWWVVSQVLLMILPGSYLVMDLAENALVSQIVTSEVSDLRADLVNLASRFTITKFVLFGASVVAVVAAQMLRPRAVT